MNRSFRPLAALATVTAGIALVSLPTTAPAIASGTGRAGPAVTVIASGLNDPKHLAFGPGGLYVAESGTGGTSCVPVAGVSDCEGQTGSVAVIGFGGAHTILSGLPSVTDPNEGTLGPAAVTFDRGRLAVLFQDTALNPDGTTSVRGPGAQALGKLMLARPFARSGGGSPLGPDLADLAAYAAAHPQDQATLGGVPGDEIPYDSDPYDIVPYAGGYAIADGAANDVLWLSDRGAISVLGRAADRARDGTRRRLRPRPGDHRRAGRPDLASS